LLKISTYGRRGEGGKVGKGRGVEGKRNRSGKVGGWEVGGEAAIIGWRGAGKDVGVRNRSHQGRIGTPAKAAHVAVLGRKAVKFNCDVVAALRGRQKSVRESFRGR
jgi:hypothetical protein